MPRTLTNQTGDGIASAAISTNIQLPDAGSSVVITGTVQAVGQSQMTITGSPLTFPSAPGSGVINVIIQVNTTTGAATVKQNTSAGTFPTVDAGNIQVFQTVLQPADSALSLDNDNVTPDTF